MFDSDDCTAFPPIPGTARFPVNVSNLVARRLHLQGEAAPGMGTDTDMFAPVASFLRA
jgi:hypothetical protein